MILNKMEKEKMVKKEVNKRGNSCFTFVDENNFTKSKHSQTTLFIILALVLIAGIAIFFILREGLTFGVPSDLEPVYNYYIKCVEQETQIGANIIGQQGGYIEGPNFSPGTEFMPFSNYLNFVGIPIPYWYYISGNNIAKEQVPSKKNMENELNKLLKNRILECDFTKFANQGFEIEVGEDIDVQTSIKKDKIKVDVSNNLVVKKGETSWTGKKHSIDVQSNLGRFYDIAKKIYDNFKEKAFLENYGVDIIRSYAPVDGVEIQCNPAVWKVEDIRTNITNAIEANTQFIKIKGDYYDLKKPENEYFIQDVGEKIEVPINFLFSKNWPTKMEVWPNDQGLLIADPIGNQEGLGLLGFCYVPYHFVYDLAFPVLIQIYDSSEIFQFPVVVYINKNRPREPIEGSNLENDVNELCRYKNTEIFVYTFNTNLESIEAEIQFKCFDEICRIGNTKNENGKTVLKEKFPQCGNGYVIASAPGYETKKEIFSTINPGSLSIFLDKKYEMELEVLNIDGKAIITFTKNKEVKTISYPEQKNIELSAGQYEIKMYVYSKSSIKLESSSEEKCIQVPKSGFGGIFGITEEKCFDLEIPSQIVDVGISGGGTQNYFISESELKSSKKIIITTNKFESPKKVEDLQLNYNRIETENLIINFK